jgi:hypothetical protein
MTPSPTRTAYPAPTGFHSGSETFANEFAATVTCAIVVSAVRTAPVPEVFDTDTDGSV